MSILSEGMIKGIDICRMLILKPDKVSIVNYNILAWLGEAVIE